MGAHVRVGRRASGELIVQSWGDDGTSSVLHAAMSGIVTTWEQAAGFDVANVLFPGSHGFDVVTQGPSAVWWVGAVADTEFTRPWKIGPEIDRTLPDGGRLRIQREGDGTGHFWERVIRTAGLIDRVYTPGYVSTRISHPTADDQHPGFSGTREQIEFGTVFSPTDHRDDEHYSKTTSSGGRDQLGRETTMTTRDSWTERGERTTGVSVTAGKAGDADFARSRSWSRTNGDDWEIVTITTDKNGDGQKTVTRGHGKDDAGTTETEDYHEDEHEHEDKDKDDDPPDKKEAGSPAGDDWGYEEGNPDGPFTGMDAITLAHLFGSGYHGQGDYDTLGDVSAAMGPYAERVRAAAAAGFGGSKEELDRLGAPPFVGDLLIGVKEDDDGVFELDTLGKPPPIHFSTVEVGVTNGVSALTKEQLLATYKEQLAGSISLNP